ncbi:MAG: hypothetical protein QNJ33_02525 [Crocosphaera sp.]|nr:hypothetical protein [Crocosphaera sp.]
MNTTTNGNHFPAFNPDLISLFQPNQVLKDKDLTNIVTYLDSHHRLTRTHLIGLGIVCGLEVRPFKIKDSDDFYIYITPGCGITSEGFFVKHDLGSDANIINKSFDRYLDVSLATNQHGLILLDVQTGSQNQPSNLTEGTTSKEQSFAVIELIKTEASDPSNTDKIKPLKELETVALDSLKEQVLLILLHWDDTERDSCINDCDNGGKERQFIPRFFVISQEIAQTLLEKRFVPPDNFQNWFKQPDCQIKRLGYQELGEEDKIFTVDLTTIETFDDLMGAYYRICKEGIIALNEGLQEIYNLFNPLFSIFHREGNPFVNFKRDFRAILLTLVPDRVIQTDPFPDDSETAVEPSPQVAYGIQYFYDYLIELTTAYNEFRDELKDTLFDLMSDCIPDRQSFPNYLLAGKIGETDTDNFNQGTSTEDLPLIPLNCTAPSLYRHSFSQSPLHNNNQRIRHLYQRLVHISKGESFQLLPFYHTPIKITPSRLRQVTLGEQAIPYYHDYLKIYTDWNYEACRKQKSQYLPAYFSLQNSPRKLGYDLINRIDWADFFRIEGHLGLVLDDALEGIKYFKNYFNLAFDIVPLRLGEGEDDPSILKGYFDDLEKDFEILKIRWKNNPLKQEITEIENTEIENTISFKIVELFEKLFFNKEDLTQIDLNSIDNEFLKYAQDFNNYDFELVGEEETKKRLILKFPGPDPEDARIALATVKNQEGEARNQIERAINFNFTVASEENRLENERRIKQTFVDCFTFDSSTLKVEYDPVELNVLRFVLINGEEEIEYVSGTIPSTKTILLRLEDETKYESADNLIERYQNFESLYVFLKHFGEAELGENYDFAGLVFYYELRLLFSCYLQRLEIIRNLQQFKEYAQENCGLEHLGGVPKGGTFVMVYTEDAQVCQRLRQRDQTIQEYFDEQVTKITEKVQFPATQKPLSIPNDSDRKIVIADFCLPYYCCGANNINYVISPPRPLIKLPKSVFCEGDKNSYGFMLYPPGGLLKGGDGVIEEEGQYVFRPYDVDEDITEPTNLTFVYILDGVSNSFTILMLPVAEVSLTIKDDSTTYCITPGETREIEFEVGVKTGNNVFESFKGEFMISTDGGNTYQVLEVSSDNKFDLATLEIPEGENSLSVQFKYRVFKTEDYCANSSEPLTITLIRQPQAKIDYDTNEEGEAEGKLVYDEDCNLVGMEIQFRNQGSEAETYQWELNNTNVADSRDVILTIPYTKERTATVTLTVSNQNHCPDEDIVTVNLPKLDPSWKFDNELPTRPEDPDNPDSSEIIVLCRTQNSEMDQQSLTVMQPGGEFTSVPSGLVLTSNNTEIPCEQRIGFTLNFAEVRPQVYTLTYTLPDGSELSRFIEVVHIPVGSFNLVVNPRLNNERESFEVRFNNVPRRRSALRYEWEITIGDRDPIITEQRSRIFNYDGDLGIKPGEPISVVMRVRHVNGICETVSEPETSQVPLLVTKLELYRTDPGGDGSEIIWLYWGDIKDNNPITIENLGEVDLNIRAITFPSEVGSVVFNLIVPEGQTAPEMTPDNTPFYDLYRNEDDSQAVGWRPEAGEFKLTATPFQEGDGEGNEGESLTVTFSLISPIIVE